MSTRGRLTAFFGSLSLAMFGLIGPAHAAHFVKVDEHAATQGPTEPAQSADQSSPCIRNFAFFGQGSFFNSQVAYVDVGSFSSLSGTCEMASETDTNFENLSVTIVSDSGDVAGPITLCFSASHDLVADSTGDGTASSTFGGGDMTPITLPATITRSPGAITIFSGGPTTILTGTDADSESSLFTANVGDTITLDVADSTHATLDGTGSANARGAARLSINIGSCIDHGAPAVSHTGLIVLAALLGALGMLTIRRRRSAIARIDGSTSATV
jgi:IPTL-CTERM motif